LFYLYGDLNSFFLPEWGFERLVLPVWGLEQLVLPGWGVEQFVLPGWGFEQLVLPGLGFEQLVLPGWGGEELFHLFFNFFLHKHRVLPLNPPRLVSYSESLYYNCKSSFICQYQFYVITIIYNFF
jgi:hypothetical protein